VLLISFWEIKDPSLLVFYRSPFHHYPFEAWRSPKKVCGGSAPAPPMFNTHLCRAVRHYTMGDRPKNLPPAFLLSQPTASRLPATASPLGPGRSLGQQEAAPRRRRHLNGHSLLILVLVLFKTEGARPSMPGRRLWHGRQAGFPSGRSQPCLHQIARLAHEVVRNSQGKPAQVSARDLVEKCAR
jgi:hypothetical protein